MTNYNGRAAFSPEDDVILGSPTITLATGVHNIFWVPRYHFLRNVWLQVLTASGAAVTATVGAMTNTVTWASAFLDNIQADLVNVGCKPGARTVLNTMAEGYWLQEDLMVTLTVMLNAGSAGTVKLFAAYKYIQ